MGCRRALAFTAVLLAAVPGGHAETFKWPEDGMSQRTSDRLSAGKRAAKFIACGVCQERALSLFPKNSDFDTVNSFFEEETLAEHLGDAKGVCGMRDLAKLFKSRKLVVKTKEDGSAELETTDGIIFYEEINTSELAFHWKSFALQHACTEVFRKDGDAVAKAIAEAYKANPDDSTAPEAVRGRILEAVRQGCDKARMCKASAKAKQTKASGEL